MSWFFGINFLIFLSVLGQNFAIETGDLQCPPLTYLKNKTLLTQEALIKELTNPCRYDKIAKPQLSTPVYVQINLNHLESSNQLQFTAYLTVQYRYKDNRLAYESLNVSRKLIYGEGSLRDRIWVPHLVISNGKDAKALGGGRSDVLVTINPGGEVVLTQRISTSFYCWMDFKKFPFDWQTCSLSWRSWSSNISQLFLQWDEDQPAQISTNLHLTEFIIDKTRTFERLVQAPFTNGLIVGNFSELVFEFNLHREIGYYMFCYFIPSILLVITSWVTFWLQADAGPPRACLGAGTVIAFITLNGGLVKDLPKISYVKASDIWSLTVSIFIFGALAEFAFVNVIWRRKKRVELVKADSMNILTGAFIPSKAREIARRSTYENGVDSFKTLDPAILQINGNKHFEATEIENEVSPTWQTMSPQDVAIWMDRKARIVFPVAFLIFNLMYWSFVYLV